LGYKTKPERKSKKTAATASTAQPATVGATPGESVAVGTAMALQHEIASRLVTLSSALVSFQQANKLTKAATTSIGDIAAQVATISGKVEDMGRALITGPDALQTMLLKSLTPKPDEQPEPANEPSEEPVEA